MAADELILSWKPERKDWEEAIRARMRTNRTRVKLRLIVAVAALATTFGFLMDMSPLIGIGIGGALGATYPFCAQYHLLLRSMWRKLPAIRYPVQARIDSRAGIVLTNSASSGHYPWNTIYDGFETDRLFVMRLKGHGKNSYLLLAKRGLPDPAQLDDLRRP